MTIDPVTTTIRREDFRTIIHQLTEDHTYTAVLGQGPPSGVVASNAAGR